MQYPEYEAPQHLTPEEYLRKFKTPHSCINACVSDDSGQDFLVLEKILDIGYNDTEQSKAIKQKALQQLKTSVKTWLYKINPNVSQRCGLQIFGSYRMGVNSRYSDVDAVCIVPTYIDRQKHFFGDFVNQLSINSNITQLFPIPTALIPLIKLKLYGVEFDILMSQVSESILNTNFDFDDEILDLVEERERKNINGCRMAAYLQKNVKNIEVFKITLKAIKMWARNRGVYLQMFSYLGGIGYTVLLTKIIQLYPNYSPLKLLSRFFYIYSKWVWQIPVLLEEGLSPQFQKSEMTIMTPIHPAMNTSHSVSKTTLKIIRRQFKQAYKIIEQIQKGNKTWNSLFAPYNILKKHKHFLQISIMANKKNEHIVWKGHIESKFRRLLKLLEGNSEYGNMIQVHPFPKQFSSKHPNYKFCSKYYIGIKCKSYNIEDDTKQIDFTPHIRMFLQIIQTYEDIYKLPEFINIGLSRVTSQEVGKQISKSTDIFYKYQ